MSDSCKNYEFLLHCLLDGEATDAERAAAESHLAACPACAAHYQELQALHTALLTLDVPAPEGLRERTMTRLRSERSAQHQRAVARWTRGLVAAAACCVFVFLGAGLLRLGGADNVLGLSGNSSASYGDADNYLLMEPDADAPINGGEADMEGAPCTAGMDGSNPEDGEQKIAPQNSAPRDASYAPAPEDTPPQNSLAVLSPESILPPDNTAVTVETSEAAVGVWLAQNRPGEGGPFYLTVEEIASLRTYLIEADTALELPETAVELIYVPDTQG